MLAESVLLQHLDNLKRVDLSGSMYLTQVPDLSLSPNLESITLQYCVRLIEAPSYIEHLEKLKELSLIGCPSLCKLSALPRNLRTLKVLTGPIQLDQTDCSCSNNITWYPSFEFSSKLERFPIIPELIKSIRTLKLDFAAIKELPSSISNLSGLKTLSLKFCQNLEFLPDSIHCLRSLRKLKIAFCRNLKSLPILPSSSLIFLDATCCASLKTMSNSVTSIKQNWDDLHNRRYKWEEFKFWGCGMLDENAHNALMDEALFRILRLATLVNKYGLYHNALDEDEGDTLARVYNKIFWSESKIPRWFSHKSEESSICMNVPHPDQWYNNSYLGLAACVIVEFDDLSTTKPISLEVYWESVYTFPNGDSWSQRRVVQFDLSYEYHVHGIRECCTTLFEDLIREDLHYDSVNNSKHVFLFMDNTY
ncbi:disease resistance protein RML1B-like, partial [Morus notabilis]|uniref:disease resistance protein RML1B-like n=1 Tax=Morus notabilis TaxID=981085 RepID=UPI000CED2ABA